MVLTLPALSHMSISSLLACRTASMHAAAALTMGRAVQGDCLTILVATAHAYIATMQIFRLCCWKGMAE